MTNLWDFKSTALRRGQEKALTKLFERVEAREPYTSIVIPTRYGKSDLMRIGAIQLHKHGIISAAFGLSPGDILTDQLSGHSRWTECIERYNLPRTARQHRVVKPEPSYAPNGECFLCATLQLMVYHSGHFADEAAKRLAATRKPFLFFIDESHFTSAKNKWGGAAETVTKAGGLVVLLTATAIREDGQPPIGFRSKKQVINPEAIRIATSKGSTPEQIKVKRYEGIETETLLDPDHETTFAEAWSEDPSPLCKVNYLPFDVLLSEEDLAGEDIDDDLIDLRISAMNSRQARQYLSRICRDPRVIREGARRLVQKLSERRRQDSKVGWIVFCDTDRTLTGDEDEFALNRWAKKIQKAIEDEGGKDLQIIIATNASEKDQGIKGQRLIEQFCAGLGDVLIVKQMGGAGLDCDRIKGVLDLSPCRGAASWTQRVMRAATPYKGFKTCDLITPDDCLAKSCWQRMIESQGGAARFEGELVEEYEVERSERPSLHVVGTANSVFHDNDGNTGLPEQYDDVRYMMEAFPQLQQFMTDADIAKRSLHLFEKIRNHNGPVANTDADLKDARDRINDLAADITLQRTGGSYQKENYGKIIESVFHAAYNRAGAAPPLEQITDLKILRNVETQLEQMLRSERSSA
jgi:hypothetical protein